MRYTFSRRFMQIPTEHDWANPYGDLDVRSAKEHFFGKTVDEAEELFVENALYYQEDIMFMPSIPFQYYVHAYINYLLGEQSKGDTEAASCFLMVVKCKMGIHENNPCTLWSRVKEIIFHVYLRILGLDESLKEPNYQSDQDDIRSVWLRIKETIEHIRKNAEWFDWKESIFGNLEEKTTRLLSWDN